MAQEEEEADQGEEIEDVLGRDDSPAEGFDMIEEVDVEEERRELNREGGQVHRESHGEDGEHQPEPGVASDPSAK